MQTFTECLNDLTNYFVLADPEALSRFQKENKLGHDLMKHFTTSQQGDKVAEEGVMIPLFGIENYPYTIYFNTENESSVFKTKESDLQFRYEGYILKVESGQIFLFTIPYLNDWKKGKKSLLKNGLKPRIQLKNGWYRVDILGGEIKEEYWEPTLEFILKKTEKIPEYKGDIQNNFHIKSREL